MKQNLLLTITSLLSILFMTFHLTDDIVRGMEPGKLLDLIAVPILVVWLYGTLVLAERRSGRIIMLLGGLAAAAMPVIHSRVNLKLFGTFFFVWTLFALGAIGTLCVILSVRALRQNGRRRE